MSAMLEAIIEASNAVTLANAFPMESIGLTAGQMQQLWDELQSARRVGLYSDPGHTIDGQTPKIIFVHTPAGQVRCFRDEGGDAVVAQAQFAWAIFKNLVAVETLDHNGVLDWLHKTWGARENFDFASFFRDMQAKLTNPAKKIITITDGQDQWILGRRD